MPLLDSTYAEIVIAFVMIGLLGLILRVTFGRELRNLSDPDPAPGSPDDDFGLLAEVAVTESAPEAAALRARLTDAGIRATTSAGRDGRYRVLVFAAELDRARHVGGFPS